MNSSLSKAAIVLGVNGELTNLNVKNLNSLRKLSKTLGCNEDDLIRNLCPNVNKQEEQQQLQVERKSRINLALNKNKINKQLNNEQLNEKNNFKSLEKDDNKRSIVLERDENLGFGFIAGSERPLLVRFVSSDGPAFKKLLAGDEILEINGVNVQYSSREQVIQLIKNSPNRIELVVKQPTPLSENSVLLTEDKKAQKRRLYKEVRFSLDDTNIEYIKKENEISQSLNIEMPISKREPSSSSSSLNISQNSKIFKVFLENHTTKSFKYDTNTKVFDVLVSLKDKLNIKCIEYYGLCIRLNDTTNLVTKWILLNETQTLNDIICLYYDQYCNFQCYFRLIYIPIDLDIFMYKDTISFNYLFEQSCNDVLNDRFGADIKYETILHLASLNILLEYTNSSQLTSSMLSLSSKSSQKLSVKYVEYENPFYLSLVSVSLPDLQLTIATVDTMLPIPELNDLFY